MAEQQPTLEKAGEMITEAARLHLLLDKHSSVEAISAALVWRFGAGSYECEHVAERALKLLDTMPRRR